MKVILAQACESASPANSVSIFCAGKLQLLYQESQQVQNKLAKSFCDNSPDILKCAQEVAEKDNFKSTYTRIVKHMSPFASINDNNCHNLQKLFPISHIIHEHNSSLIDANAAPTLEPPRMTTQAATVAALTKKRGVITPQEAIIFLHPFCYGKAPGVQVNSIYLFLKMLRRLTSRVTPIAGDCNCT